MTKAKLTAGILGNYVAWELCLDLTWSEMIDWALVEVSNLLNNIGTLLNQFTFWFLIKLSIQFAMKFFEFYHFCLFCSLDTVKSD